MTEMIPRRLALIATIAAMLLPLAGLGAIWRISHKEAQIGTEWDVPLLGYDPRDVLRGHYVQFLYDWPGLTDRERGEPPHALCIRGDAPHIDSARPIKDGTVPPADCDDIVRINEWSGEKYWGLVNGRHYIPQKQAAEYTKKLNDRDLVTTIRIRVDADGHIRTVALNFKKQPDEGE